MDISRMKNMGAYQVVPECCTLLDTYTSNPRYEPIIPLVRVAELSVSRIIFARVIFSLTQGGTTATRPACGALASSSSRAAPVNKEMMLALVIEVGEPVVPETTMPASA